MPKSQDFSSGERSNLGDLDFDPLLPDSSLVQEDVPIQLVELAEAAEPAAMLTADRLLQDRAKLKEIPEGGLRPLIFKASLGRVNLGDSKKVQARKALDARIAASLAGSTKFVPILTRKGGVGKTTITALLGMALSEIREDRVLAIDANPDRGTLSERVARTTEKTVRDVVNKASSITGFQVFSQYVSRDKTRLDVLASDTDPMISEAFNEGDYNVVADVASRYYSICLTDCGTGIVHSVMRAILQRADGLVVVSGGSIDEAKLASETLTWLESNGYSDLVAESVVAVNTGTYGTDLIKIDEIVSHFSSRVRAVVTVPYDKQLASGGVIDYSKLHPETRHAARELAALVMEGLVNER